MEKILRIEETTFNAKMEGSYSENYDGFEIVTNKQTIRVGIDNSQCCCEDFGCLMTEDNVSEFIGSNLKSIRLVDSALNGKKIEQLEYLDCGDAMFVNFETDNGLFQIVAYNSHNGYYGHEAVLISNQLTETKGC